MNLGKAEVPVTARKKTAAPLFLRLSAPVPDANRPDERTEKDVIEQRSHDRRDNPDEGKVRVPGQEAGLRGEIFGNANGSHGY